MKQFPTHIVTVCGIVENERNEILLVKHRDKGVWGVPGGQVEVGENIMDALIREIKEESGIDVTVNKLVCITSNTCTYKGYNGYETVPTKVMFDFTCTFIGGTLTTSDETSESRWIPKDSVLDYIKLPCFVEKFMTYLKYDGNIQYLEYVTKPTYDLKLKRKV